MKISTKLVLSFLFISIIPLLSLTLFAIDSSHKAFKESIGHNYQYIATEKAAAISHVLAENIAEVKAIAEHPLLKSDLKEANSRYRNLSDEDILERIAKVDKKWIETKGKAEEALSVRESDISGLFRSIKGLGGEKFGEIFLTDIKGAAIAMTGNLSDYYQADEFWWQESYSNEKGNAFLDDRGYDLSIEAIALGIVVPVMEQGKVLGILKVNVRVAEFLNFLKPDKDEIAFGFDATLARSQGTMIVTSKNSQHFEMSNTEKKLLENGKPGWLIDSHNDQKHIIGFSPVSITIHARVPSPNAITGISGEKWEQSLWYILVEIEMNAAMSHLNNRHDTIFFAGLAFLFLSILVAFMLARSFSRPIETLVKGVGIIGGGDLTHAVEISRKDELGTLARSVNRMAETLNATTVSRDEMVKEKEKGQQYLDIAGVMLLSLDKDGTVLLINKRGCKILGYDSYEEIIGKNWFENFLPPRMVAEVREIFAQLMKGKVELVEFFENPVCMKNGRERVIAWHNSILTNEKGEITGLFSSGEDVTLRNRYERTLKMLRECNQHLIHSQSEEELFQRMCDIIANQGGDGYRLAWICNVEEGEENTVTPVAFHCNDSTCDCLQRPLLEEGECHGAAWMAVMEGKTVAFQDILNNPACEAWRERAIENGYESTISILLREPRGTELWGVLNIFSVLPFAFQNEERALLEELAEDISFSMKKFRIEQEKEAAAIKIQESESKYHSLFEQMMEGFAYCRNVVDKKGRIINYAYLEVNDAFERITGLNRNDVLGVNISHAIPGYRTFYRKLFKKYRELVKKGNSARFAIYFEPIGKWLSIATYSPAEGDFVVTFHDITKRKEAEQALLESRERFISLIESSLDAVISANSKGEIISWNKSAEKIFGYQEKEMLCRTITDIMPERFRKRHMAGIERFLKTKEGKVLGKTVELYGLRKDGTEFPIELSLSCWEGGGEVYFSAFVRDITQRKRALEELQTLGNAIEQSTEMIMITNANGVIEYVNPAAEVLTGYAKEELLGQNPHLLSSGKQDSRFFRDMWKTISAGKDWEGTLLNKKKSGVLFEEKMTISPVLNEENAITHFVAIKRDITQEKKIHQQLIHSEKLSTVGTFVSGVAHELNNPLTSVIGLSELLLEESDLPERVMKKLKVIFEQSDRTVKIVNNLLRFSRKGSSEKNVIDMNELLERSLQLYEYRLKNDNIEVTLEMATGPSRVFGVESELQQVIMNIMVNAHQALLQQKGGKLNLSTRLENKKVVIAIENDGLPIPEEHLSELFDPFYTSKEVGEGTGLGLYICYTIIEGHHGQISVENLPHKGVRFLISLPLHAEKPVVKERKKTEGKSIKGLRFLVVDDEETIRTYLTQLVRRRKGLCLAVKSSREAMEALEKSRFDFIITDIKMPGISGLEFSKWLMERKPEMMKRLIILTGLIDFETEDFVKENKCFLLVKPASITKLLNAIESLLDI